MKIHNIHIYQDDNGDFQVSIKQNHSTVYNTHDKKPSPLGFYRCPASIGSRKGFRDLKTSIEKQYKDKIKHYQNSLKKLKKLKYPNEILTKRS